MTDIFDMVGVMSEGEINRAGQKKPAIIETTRFQFDQSK